MKLNDILCVFYFYPELANSFCPSFRVVFLSILIFLFTHLIRALTCDYDSVMPMMIDIVEMIFLYFQLLEVIFKDEIPGFFSLGCWRWSV